MTKINQKKIVVVVGPTSSGKSGLGIKIARKFNGEVISADSRQVYLKMDIGTGKITKKEQKIVRHHLLDVASPKKQFTADDFKKLGEKAINDIINRAKIPIIVGGTGFYIDILLGRMSVAEVPPNQKLRAKLEKHSAEQLFKRLKKLDPQRAKTIESKNKRRLIRALEIVITTGKPVPKSNTKQNTKYSILWLGLRPQNLETRIKKRLDARLKQGMVKEVKNLLKSGVGKKRLYDFGLEYRWLARYLNKEIDYKGMKEGLLRDIIKYSKRQMIWFKRNKDIKWLAQASAPARASVLVKRFLRV